MEDARKSHGYYLIGLQADGSDMKLLLQNERLTSIWMLILEAEHLRTFPGLLLRYIFNQSLPTCLQQWHVVHLGLSLR